LVILLLALITFSVAYYAGHTQKRHRRLPVIDGVLINPPLPFPAIDLFTQESKVFSLSDMRGHWNLLMLDPDPGLATSASDALTRLTQVHNRMATNPDLQQQIHYLYLSLEEVDEAAISFASISANFQILHGDGAQVKNAFQALGGTTDDKQFTLYLIGPKTKLHALFTQNNNAATIADDLHNLIIALR
jgi:cytochrome oxidase Cu insertion factor (SCO1/SenC/PrrC family)